MKVNNLLKKLNPLLSAVFHTSCAVFHFYAINWLLFIGLNITEMASFFTVWTTIFHLIMNIVLAAHDVFVMFSFPKYISDNRYQNGNEKGANPDIAKGFFSREVLLGLLLHLAIVMSAFTQLVFWMLYHFDRELILPESTNFPSFLNHMLHTFPLLLAILALFVFSLNFPSAKRESQCRTISVAGRKLANFVAFAYFVVTLVVFELKGSWPYPFMFSFTRVEFLAFSSVVFAFANALCYVCSLLEFRIKNLNIV